MQFNGWEHDNEHATLAYDRFIFRKLHEARIPLLLDSWVKGNEDITFVFSDSDNDTLSDGRKIPNFINTKCPKDHNTGLHCKNTFMMDWFRAQPWLGTAMLPYY
jgi:hypothetical protein